MTGRARESSLPEFSVLSKQRQLPPVDPLPAPLPGVPKECESFWRLKRALDRLDAPIPGQNALVKQDPDNPEPSQPLNRPKRRADPPTPQPKCVKLSSSDSKVPLSTPGSYSLPLHGLVVFVDSKMEGISTSGHWGDILRDLGARVRRSLCIRIF